MPANQDHASSEKKRITIGVLIHEIINIVPAKVIKGILKCAQDHEINIVFFIGNAFKSPHNFESQANVIYELANKERLDGLIIWAGTLVTYINADELLNYIHSRSLPAVSVELKLKNIPSILLDDYKGMYEILDHLIREHGLKRIGFIRAVENQPACLERFRAYKDILKENNIPFDPKLVPKGKDNWEGITEIKSFFEGVQINLEAIVSVSDACLKTAIPLINSYGKKIPEDIALAGYDNNADMSACDPPLTTVDPSHFNLGYNAVKMLKSCIEGKKIADDVDFVKPKLIVRQSCGCDSQSIRMVSLSNPDIKKAYRRFNKKRLIEELKKIFDCLEAGINSTWAEQLYESFISDIKKDHGKYLKVLKDFTNIILEHDDISVLENIITLLFHYVMDKHSWKLKKNAFSLIEQSRIMITEITLRAKIRQNINVEEISIKVNELCLLLISTFDINEIMAILSNGLPKIGIKKCYISLYENPLKSLEEARLILAFDQNGNKKIENGGRLFKSRLLVPHDILQSNDIGEMLALPLYFHDEQLGFIFISTGIPDIRLYETLRVQICSALQGAKLVRKINSHSQILIQGIASLLQSLEEMTKNITSISNNMALQADAVTKDAGAIEQLVRNIGYITENSTKANELSVNLNLHAIEGKDMIKKALFSANEVQNNSKKILNLLELINEIAAKTNILAINAAIQSANYGEKGKGFSVVSSEIKKLADDTNKNINSITEEVKAIITSIDNSVKMTEKTTEGLEMISAYSIQNVNFISELNSAMIEQNNGINEILKSSHDLLKITEAVKSAIMKQKTATDDFNHSLKKLTEISNNN